MSVVAKYDATMVNNEPGILITPKLWRGNNTVPGILYCHGYNNSQFEGWGPAIGYDNTTRIMDRLVNAGYPVLSCNLGGNIWGNADAMTRVTAAYNYLQSIGTMPGRVMMYGHSMGHATAMNWTAQNRSKVACVFSEIGVADLNNIHGEAGYTATIDSAYSGGYTDATYGATYNPTINAATKYAGLPWLACYGDVDTVAVPERTRNLAAVIGSTATAISVSGGHSLDTIGNFPIDTIVKFFQANAS